MKPKISIVGLAVADIPRSVRFYGEGLGFPVHNYKEGDDFVLFRLEGAWLSLEQQEARMKALPVGAQTFSTVSLSHNVASEAAVRDVYTQAINAGATPTTPPRKAHWGGYEAGFADPDGHRWDIAYNPFTDLT